jgi:hypothetical protein
MKLAGRMQAIATAACAYGRPGAPFHCCVQPEGYDPLVVNDARQPLLDRLEGSRGKPVMKDARPSGSAKAAIKDKHGTLARDAREEINQRIERDRCRCEVCGVSIMRDEEEVVGPVASIGDENKVFLASRVDEHF